MDELGVAEAAFQPSLSQAMEIASSHIMAMPLDYVIAWGTARLSHAEGWLRLPEALWGILTLLAGYRLSLQLSGSRRIALFALLLLSLSPLLITYSQELRFYAPLTFFYTISTYLGLKAVQQSHTLDWIVFTLVALPGIYFHLYTILAVGSVFLWLATYFGKENWIERRNAFAVSALTLSIAFLIGMFTFGGVYAEHKLSLFLYEPLSEFLLTGLGWKPPFPSSPAGWTLGLLYMVFAMFGVVSNLRKNPSGPGSILFYSIVLQIGLVMIFDVLKNYPLFARQIIMLAPAMIYFSACGVDWAIDQISAHWKLPLHQTSVTAFLGAVFVFAAIPTLNEYYQVHKGSLHDIYVVISETWQRPEPIHMEADIQAVYSYYWAQDPQNQSLVDAFTPMDYASTDGWDYPQPAWFITNYPPIQGMDAALRSAGFLPVYIPADHTTVHPQMLWHRK